MRLTRSVVAANRAAGFLYVATMFASVVSFAYQFVMARLLAPPDYAILTALFGYLLLESISTQVIQSAAASLAARYRARAEEAALRAFVRRWLLRLAVLSGLPAVAIIALAPFLGGLLALPPLTVALLGVVLVAVALLTLTQGMLQGLRSFGWLGAVLVAQAAGRLAFGVALVLAGYGVTGAFLAAASAPIIGLLLSLVPLRPLLGPSPDADGEHAAHLGRSETRFFLLAAVVLLAYAALTNLDAVLARGLLGPVAAGDYAGAITLGKVILFAPLAVGFILLERTARAHARGEPTERALLLALGFVLATSGAVSLAYLVAPAFFTAIVVGPSYPGAVALAGRYGLAALANALLSIWLAYFVGRGEMRVGVVLAVGVLVEAVLLIGFARDAEAMVTTVLGVAVAMQIAAVLTFLSQRR